jgi:putative ABC transport system substrate-binding protein
VNGPDEFDDALARAKRDRVGAILATPDPVTFLDRKRLVEAALKHQLPGIYWTREFVEDGGLMSYSANFTDLLRRAAVYVDNISKVPNPPRCPSSNRRSSSWPSTQNRQDPRTIITIPPSLLLRADEVFE